MNSFSLRISFLDAVLKNFRLKKLDFFFIEKYFWGTVQQIYSDIKWMISLEPYCKIAIDPEYQRQLSYCSLFDID